MVREGENLILKMKISLYDSLCGLNKIIKHLDGRNVLLKYEKVINPYSKMFIENEGMIDVNGTIGDLIIEFASKVEPYSFGLLRLKSAVE